MLGLQPARSAESSRARIYPAERQKPQSAHDVARPGHALSRLTNLGPCSPELPKLVDLVDLVDQFPKLTKKIQL
jgi:hypothetical protein